MYQNDNQKILIHKTCGYQKEFDMIKRLPSIQVEYPWLKEADYCSLRCVIFNLEDAYFNSFSKRSSYQH